MDQQERNRRIIENILSDHANIPFAHVDVQSEVEFDRDRDRYLLVNAGWDNGRRAHWVGVHVDIIDGKFWIQCDNTEEGAATELMAAGVPREKIVLGFRSPERRQHSDFAVA